jgi:hypothetical protein
MGGSAPLLALHALRAAGEVSAVAGLAPPAPRVDHATIALSNPGLASTPPHGP